MKLRARPWQWNVTPESVEQYPRGTWSITGISIDHGEFPYNTYLRLVVTIRHNAGRTTTGKNKWKYSVLEIPDDVFGKENYARLLGGERPCHITVDKTGIELTWSHEKRSGDMSIFKTR
jgi:hypothetical protein